MGASIIWGGNTPAVGEPAGNGTAPPPTSAWNAHTHPNASPPAPCVVVVVPGSERVLCGGRWDAGRVVVVVVGEWRGIEGLRIGNGAGVGGKAAGFDGGAGEWDDAADAGLSGGVPTERRSCSRDSVVPCARGLSGWVGSGMVPRRPASWRVLSYAAVSRMRTLCGSSVGWGR
jgi:hypothetical protein